MKTDSDPFVLSGISANSLTLSSSEFTDVRYIMLSILRFPDGVIALFFATASTTSSGEILNRLSFSGSTLITTDLEFAPKGGGADNPLTEENIGLTLVATRSYISLSDFDLLLKTNCPTGSEDASKRITCGGNAPGGKNFDARFTCKATCAEASAMSVLS